jgi:mycothiol system anti-sigma-R factor
MSCGKPHAVDCAQILNRVYEYLDNELQELDCETVREHLDECGPCLAKYGLERAVMKLVHRSCGCDDVPADLRSKVLLRIRQVQVDLSLQESPPTRNG